MTNYFNIDQSLIIIVQNNQSLITIFYQKDLSPLRDWSPLLSLNNHSSPFFNQKPITDLHYPNNQSLLAIVSSYQSLSTYFKQTPITHHHRSQRSLFTFISSGWSLATISLNNQLLPVITISDHQDQILITTVREWPIAVHSYKYQSLINIYPQWPITNPNHSPMTNHWSLLSVSHVHFFNS